MPRRTRKYLAVSLALSLTGVLAGCSGAESADSDAIELEFWNPEADEAVISVLETMIEKYEAENPNVNVNLVTVPWSDIFTKWQAALQGGNAPDVTLGSAAFAASLQEQGVLLPLNDVVEAIGGEEAWADTASSLVELSKTPDGEYFALPYSTNSVVLWYNKPMFELPASSRRPPGTSSRRPPRR